MLTLTGLIGFGLYRHESRTALPKPTAVVLCLCCWHSETLWIWELHLAVPRMMKSYESASAESKQKATQNISMILWPSNKKSRLGLPSRVSLAGRESLFGETQLHCVDCSTYSYLVLLHKETRGVCKKAQYAGANLGVTGCKNTIILELC